MSYDVATGAALMRHWSLATISLVQAENPSRFHTPSLGQNRAEPIEIIQGADMGIPCLLRADLPDGPGGAARVHGSARIIGEAG